MDLRLIKSLPPESAKPADSNSAQDTLSSSSSGTPEQKTVEFLLRAFVQSLLRGRSRGTVR